MTCRSGPGFAFPARTFRAWFAIPVILKPATDAANKSIEGIDIMSALSNFTAL